MEECDLLKERLLAITEKHRIQDNIRDKKLELDQEKLKLQHLKKKALREQWLLQDSQASHNIDFTQQQSLLSDQQQTRALQLSIHKIEMEVESLEREESRISTKESFILNKLKAVEKSPEDIIKEAQDSFVPELLQVTMVVPDIPKCLSPPAKKHYEPSTPTNTLFAMEINVTKSMLTGESTVPSTASEELNHHAGFKGSCNPSCVSELSANEVEQLLRSAIAHRQVKHQNYQQNPSRRGESCFYNHQYETDRVEGCDLTNQGGHSGNHVLRSNIAENDVSCRDTWQRTPHDHHRYSYQEDRNNQRNLRKRYYLGNHGGLGHNYGNQKESRLYSLYQTVQEDGPASYCTSSIIRSSSSVNGTQPNGCPPPRSHDQEAVTACQPQLYYTPANYIPFSDYISVDEEEVYCYSPLSYLSYSQTENSHNQSTARYNGLTHCHRVPSPLYSDDTPYTILNALETTEPITAIFMGFQTAQDDSGQVQEIDGSLEAELVIVEDNEDNCEDSSMKERKGHSHSRTGNLTNENMGLLEEGGRTEKQVGSGIRKIQKKHKPCCSIC